MKKLILNICFALAFVGAADAATSLRGMMIPPAPDAATIEALTNTGANLARWQLNTPAADSMTLSQYQSWINQQIVQIDALLPVFAQHNMRVVIDLHSPPGGFSQRTGYAVYRMFHVGWAETCFVDVWKILAQRYRGNSTIWAFDILNEPCTGNNTYVFS